MQMTGSELGPRHCVSHFGGSRPREPKTFRGGDIVSFALISLFLLIVYSSAAASAVELIVFFSYACH